MLCLNAQTDTIQNRKAPEMVFEKTEHEFGTMPYGGNGTCEFVFKNKGKAPLIISNVERDCVCTTVDWPKEPIKKGDKGVIKVIYDTRRTGVFTKAVTVYSNAKIPIINLWFKGKVEPAASKENTKIIVFPEKMH